MMSFFTTLLFVLAPIFQLDRVAIIHDGNFYDKDDIGAVAMSEALIWRRGAQDRLVHLTYNSQMGANNQSQANEMIISAEGNLTAFGIDPTLVFDGSRELGDATQHLALELRKSNANNKLVLIQGGPWASMALAFDTAAPQTHQHVTIISHSIWNDTFKELWWHKNKDSFFAQYNPGGVFYGFTPPSYVKINDQNGPAFKSHISEWTWLNNVPETTFVYNRTFASDYAQGDMSDAGMVYYYLTGNSNPNMGQIKAFFGQ